jgi:large subunit ribosomal protein L15
MKLNQISDNKGARKARTRVGRGIGSGLGKTAGRGGKGQTARKGGAKAGFEGGQMPVQVAVDSKMLDAKAPVTAAALLAAGVISKLAEGGVRLIGKEKFTAKLAFEVYYATKGAVAAIEKAGGSVKITRPAPEAKQA